PFCLPPDRMGRNLPTSFRHGEPTRQPCYSHNSLTSPFGRPASCFVFLHTTTISHFAALRFEACPAQNNGDTTMKRLIASVVVVAIVGLAAQAMAADATGTWKWTVSFNGQTRDSTLKL